MGKLLTVLGIDESKQGKLPESVFKAEKVLIAMQAVYANAPDSPKKEKLAVTISEMAKLLLAKVQPYLIEEKKEDSIKDEVKKLPEEKKPEIKKEVPPKPKPEEKPKKEEPKPKKETPPPPPNPNKHKPKEPPKKEEHEIPLTCEELKDAIKGLNLIAKTGDSEAKDLIKELKVKLKNQNCK